MPLLSLSWRSSLGRALSDPEKAAGALRRTGVILTAQQQDQIKAFEERNRIRDGLLMRISERLSEGDLSDAQVTMR